MVFDIFRSDSNDFDTQDRSDSLGSYLENEHPRKFSTDETEIEISRVGKNEYEFTIKNHIPQKKVTDKYHGNAEYTGSGWKSEITENDVNL